MKLFLTTLLLSSSLFVMAQSKSSLDDSESFCHPENLVNLVSGKEKVGYLFFGDLVELDSISQSPRKDLWEVLERKTDVVVVFSEEHKKAAKESTSLPVILSDEDYEYYFIEPRSFMKKWLWFTLNNGNTEDVTASSKGNDLVRKD